MVAWGIAWVIASGIASVGLAALGGCDDPPLDRALAEPPPPASRGIRAWPILRRGTRGPSVELAARLLAHRGRRAPIEGAFTAELERAVRGFQEDVGLEVDGVVGPATWEALITWIELGSHSLAVGAAQRLLVAAGYAIAIDEELGADDAAALADLQAHRCLVPSGGAGVFTWSALVAGPGYCEGGPAGLLSIEEVAALAIAAQLPCGDPLATAVAIARAESGLRGELIRRNPPTAGCADGSDDVGLWQLNDCYHPEVSRACALDAACNARAMREISQGGTDFGPWSAYKSQAYVAFLPEARDAAARACR